MADDHLNTPEVWKAISDFPGYEVSDQGRVRSYWRKVGLGRGHNGGTKQVLDAMPQRILRPRIRPAGYKDVNLRRDGKDYHSSVHKLVLITFIGPRPPGMEACHNDGKPSNNFLSNLRWDTHKNNKLDSIKHGTTPSTLTTNQVIEIKNLISNNIHSKEIANIFSVSKSAIDHIKYNRSWKHLISHRNS
jgi:hypothetical protein